MELPEVHAVDEHREICGVGVVHLGVLQGRRAKHIGIRDGAADQPQQSPRARASGQRDAGGF